MTNWQDYPAGTPDLADTLLIRDVSDNSSVAAGKLKQVTIGDLLALLSGGGTTGTTGGGTSGTFSAVGDWIQTTGLSFTWAPAAVGNVLVVIAFSTVSGSPVTALASSNATWAKIVSGVKAGTTTVTEETAFTGTASAASSATVTLTTGAASGNIRLLAHEFSTGGLPVTLDKFATMDGDVSGPVTAWPSASPAGSGELLFGYERNFNNVNVSAVAGTDAGVTYHIDANDNGGAYKLSVSSAAAVGWGDSDSRTALVLLLSAGSGSSGGGGGGGGGGFTASTVPILGMYQTSGAFPTPGASAWPSGPTTNLSATYLSFDADWATYGAPFVAKCNANGLVPFVELEPWHYNQSAVPFTDITSGLWDTYLTGIGTAIAATGKPVILTFAHEMNVSGQYPWSQGDTGSGPGGGTLSATDWKTGWNYVRNKINSTAGGHALWMWACSAWTGGTTIDPSPWWPGAGNLDMVGIDGYPNTKYGQSLGTFFGQFGQTMTAIRNLGWSGPVFLSETNLREMVDSGGQSIASFVADMHTAGCSGILEFEDASWGLSPMTSAQWTQYNNAVAQYYG